MRKEATVTIVAEEALPPPPPPPETWWQKVVAWWSGLSAWQKAMLIAGTAATGTSVVYLAVRR